MRFSVHGLLGLIALATMGYVCYSNGWAVVPWLYVTFATAFYGLAVTSATRAKWVSLSRKAKILWGSHIAYILAAFCLQFKLDGFLQYFFALVGSYFVGNFISGSFFADENSDTDEVVTGTRFNFHGILGIIGLGVMGYIVYEKNLVETWDFPWLYIAVAVLVYMGTVLKRWHRAPENRVKIARRQWGAHLSFACLCAGLYIPGVNSFWSYLGVMICSYAVGAIVSSMLIEEDTAPLSL
ncbi:MAG: hypothetical protein WC712_08420 [Candidatus Brocadiia bacterium]